MTKSASLTTRFIDLMMRPQISHFCFESALRMSRTDVRRGGKIAITAVHDAIKSSLHEKDDSQLNMMLTDGLLAPPLHLALSSEIRRGREEGEWATELMLTELTEQAQQVDDGEVTLTRTRLIAGAQREVMNDSMLSMHRLHVGSHMIVIDNDPSGLWRVDRQRELMLRRGCCVQLELQFAGLGVRAGVCKPQVLLLEASVAGQMLVDGPRNTREGGDDDELQMIVADLNQMTGGSFWQSAALVDPWWGG